jgi:tRNA G18 (ribose-2'-O)-methylase SpoU
VVEALLDNIRSIYNVGAMLRTADGAGLRHLYLCGITATPGHPRMAKTALGSEDAVPWTAHPNALDAADGLLAQGYRLWALESGAQAGSLFALDSLPAAPLVLVVGNELAGVDAALLARCERVLSIPMHGIKGSLNAAVAFGIAAYYLRFGVPALRSATEKR